MDSQEIAPYKPLPPQRWGFLPTNQFWYHAMLTPISLVFWGGAAVFFAFFDLFALVWWQQSLGWMVFWCTWAGLVERYARRYLARRRLRGLAGPRTDFPEDIEEATAAVPARPLTPPPEPPGPPACAPGPSRTLGSRLALVQRVDSWDLAYERLFGRGGEIAHFAFNLAFGLAIFHPSWFVKLLGILALLGAARGVGSWERRQATAAIEEVPRPALVREGGHGSRPGHPSGSSTGTGKRIGGGGDAGSAEGVTAECESGTFD